MSPDRPPSLPAASLLVPKRVVLWIDEINDDFLQALRGQGVEVAALLQCSHAGVPSFSLHDLYYGGPRLEQLGRALAPPEWIDDASYRLYARCIQRVGFYPGCEFLETVSGGVASPTDMEDWARVHLNHALGLLEGVQADEVWFCFTPHLGVDNMLALAAQRTGRTCLVFSQIKFATKFAWKQLGSREGGGQTSHALKWKRWQGGAVQPNLFYMRENDTDRWYENLPQRLGSFAARIHNADWTSVASRLYLGARKRRWWRAMWLMERMDRRARPWAGYRLALRHGFDRVMRRQPVLEAGADIGDYLYFPLHLEPEENVHALGGDFTNQLDAVEALHRLLPDGWTLVLKENPKQTFQHRGPAFQLRIAGLPRVRFVDPRAASAPLIANARLVASITGTAGYEAMLAGKPCVYCGEAWYAGLPGATPYTAGMDLLGLAQQAVDPDALDAAVDALLSGLADGLAHPRYAGIHRHAHDLSTLYREAAASMCAISATVGVAKAQAIRLPDPR